MNPVRVEDEETLGRCVFDSDNAGRNSPRTRFFEEAFTYGNGRVSVDRMDYADVDILCEVHDDEARGRGSNRSFYGWFTFGTELARDISLEVEPTASTDPRNKWHADLMILDFASDEGDRILVYAEALKSEAEWRPRPLNSRFREDIEEAIGELD